MTDSYYRSHTFTINEKQSRHIDDRVYQDKKLPQDEREFPNGQRSEYIRNKINEEMKDENRITSIQN